MWFVNIIIIIIIIGMSVQEYLLAIFDWSLANTIELAAVVDVQIVFDHTNDLPDETRILDASERHKFRLFKELRERYVFLSQHTNNFKKSNESNKSSVKN